MFVQVLVVLTLIKWVLMLIQLRVQLLEWR